MKRGKDGHPVTPRLKKQGGIDDEPFGAAEAEVGVDESNVQRLAQGSGLKV
jgi:hypothetical protein